MGQLVAKLRDQEVISRSSEKSKAALHLKLQLSVLLLHDCLEAQLLSEVEEWRERPKVLVFEASSCAASAASLEGAVSSRSSWPSRHVLIYPGLLSMGLSESTWLPHAALKKPRQG